MNSVSTASVTRVLTGTGIVITPAMNGEVVQLPAGRVFLVKLGRQHGKPARATAKEIRDSLAETTAYPLANAKVRHMSFLLSPSDPALIPSSFSSAA